VTFPIDILIHVANVLYLFAYMVRDMLWLRVLTVVGAFCLMPFYYFRTEPLMAPLYWTLLFTALNLYWIVRLLIERAPKKLTADEQRLCELVFRTMSPREMIRLLKLATWEQAEIGERLVEHRKPLDRLMVIFSGRARAEVDGRTVTDLSPGQFIGAIDFVAQEAASADVRAIETTRYVAWPKSKLRNVMRDNPELHLALESTLAIDLTKLIEGTWTREIDGTPRNATETFPER
jgi:hypothetical protein